MQQLQLCLTSQEKILSYLARWHCVVAGRSFIVGWLLARYVTMGGDRTIERLIAFLSLVLWISQGRIGAWDKIAFGPLDPLCIIKRVNPLKLLCSFPSAPPRGIGKYWNCQRSKLLRRLFHAVKNKNSPVQAELVIVTSSGHAKSVNVSHCHSKQRLFSFLLLNS